jgi:hypothetical protein
VKVYQSISMVSAELAHEGISKDRSNQQQGYKFRGIDDCLNALAPLLSRSNLVILPEVLEREVVERQTKSGGALFYVTVKVKYAFVNSEDDSRHDVVTYGEAMDSADKATNKAMSAAYKYAVIQAFCIPTEGENDADAVTHDVAAKKAQAYTASKQTAQAKIAELAKEMQEPARQDGGDRTKDKVDTQQGPDAAAPFIWRLGKHKGQAVTGIELSYLTWACTNMQAEDHRQAAADEIDRRQKQDVMAFEGQE